MAYGSFRTRDVAFPLLKGCALFIVVGGLILFGLGAVIGKVL